MTVTYLYHSGFVVEFDDIVLVFDYYKGELPETVRGKKLYVFSSHYHKDHFQYKVFDWALEYDATYVLSKDIRTKGPEGRTVKVKRRQNLSVDELQIQTLRSTDEGVAFLVRVKGITLYHAGDLNWWHWEEESEEFNRWQEDTYKQQIKLLNGRKIDLSFVTVDPRLGNNQFLGIDFFMQQVKTGYVLPMHLWKHYELIKQYRQKPENSGWRERILTVDRENQEIVV